GEFGLWVGGCVLKKGILFFFFFVVFCVVAVSFIIRCFYLWLVLCFGGGFIVVFVKFFQWL
ncbi:hypothetical protein, partial [Limosilactobacillus reuteri]|uniref:hypothetical protein n=1 Tax=Limosilactobacillus reuteri TaxID=1598 RepID=UPI002AFF6841